MLNFNPEHTDQRRLENNFRAVERHVNDDHYVRGFTPGEFVLSGAAAPTHVVRIAGGNETWSAVEMADGGTSFATVSWRKPSEWRSGRLRIQFWYSSDVGSTNDFRIQTIVRAVKAGDIIEGAGSLSLLSSSVNRAGPAVANTIIKTALEYTTTSFGGDDELFTLRIGRIGADAADTNVNDFHLLYVTVEHIPAYQEAT